MLAGAGKGDAHHPDRCSAWSMGQEIAVSRLLSLLRLSGLPAYHREGFRPLSLSRASDADIQERPEQPL